MVFAQSGCIIVSWNGSQGQYQKKCNYCGHVEIYQKCGFSMSGTGTSSHGSFSCPQCKKSSDIKIGKS
jgi:hypothetical protein